MKYSGIKWIGEIPDNWNVRKVKQCFYISKEQAHEENPTILSLARAGVKVRDISNNEGQLAASYDNYNPVMPGDLLLNPMDLYSGANCSLSEVSGVISPAYINLRKKVELNPKFYDYFFKTQYWAMAMFAHGKGVSFDNRWTMNAETLLNYYLPFPSSDVQDKIVDLINKKTAEIDSLIEIENQQIEKLKEYVESSIYEYLKKELGVSINDMSFESRTSMKKIGALSNLVTKQTGFDYSNTIKPTMLDNPNEDSLPYLQTRNFKNNYFNLNTEFYVPKSTWEQFPKLILDDETLLFSIVGASIGNVAIFPKSEKAFLGGAICRVNLVDKEYALFIKEIMLSKFGQEQIYRKINSNAQGTITVQNVRDFLIPMPSKKDAVRIGQKCESMRKEVDDLITIKEKKIDVLTEYKKSLIYEYVTGKKEVC